MKINILPSASQDLVDGYCFYEKQAEGVGNYFLDSLYSDIDSLIINAGVHPIYFNKYYRMLSKRFPFAAYYKLENNIIHIYAVLDCRKNPAWLRNKLK
ncbi:MAG: hypothetical protein ABUK01_11000 [Leptospirales bacterium]